MTQSFLVIMVNGFKNIDKSESSSLMALSKRSSTSLSSSSSSNSLSSNSNNHNGKLAATNTGLNSNNNHNSNSLSSSSNSGSLFKPLMSSFLSSTSINGVPNPYPFRTMIGNLMFRLRQHRTQMLLIPSAVRIVYQYRRPILDGLASAYQSLVAANPVALASAPSASNGARVSGSADLDDYGPMMNHNKFLHDSDPMMTSASSPFLQMLTAASNNLAADNQQGNRIVYDQVPRTNNGDYHPQLAMSPGLYNLMTATAYQQALQQAATLETPANHQTIEPLIAEATNIAYSPVEAAALYDSYQPYEFI